MRTAWLALAATACATPGASSRPESSAAQAGASQPATAPPIEPDRPEPAAGDPATDSSPDLHFQVLVGERTQLAAGQSGAVSLTVLPGPGHTISQIGPLRVDLAVDPPTGLEVPRRRYRRDQAADRRAAAPRFDLAVRGVRPGLYVLAIDVRLWLCRGSARCHPARRAVAPVVEVRGPAEPAPPAPAQR